MEKVLRDNVSCRGCVKVVALMGERVAPWPTNLLSTLPAGRAYEVVVAREPHAVVRCDRCAIITTISASVRCTVTRPLPDLRCPCCGGRVEGSREVEVRYYHSHVAAGA
jgi:hypothetical protein